MNAVPSTDANGRPTSNSAMAIRVPHVSYFQHFFQSIVLIHIILILFCYHFVFQEIGCGGLDGDPSTVAEIIGVALQNSFPRFESYNAVTKNAEAVEQAMANKADMRNDINRIQVGFQGVKYE